MYHRMIFLAAFLLIFGCHDSLSQPKQDEVPYRNAVQDTGTVRSADGTLIGYRKVGSGPVPLVIVPGAFNSSDQWTPVAMALAEHCTCYVMDRRGRPLSGDMGAGYDLEKEVEDIEAVLGKAGPDACLLGHSSGAIYALEAARRFAVEGLVLYEPPLHFQEDDLFERIREKHQAGAYGELVRIFFKREVGMPEEQLAGLKQSPLWRAMVTLAPTFVPEWEAIFAADLDPDRYRELTVPTLLLTGTLTEDHPSMATVELASMLSEVEKVMLEGFGHGANLAAPELVAEEVSGFLRKVAQ